MSFLIFGVNIAVPLEEGIFTIRFSTEKTAPCWQELEPLPTVRGNDWSIHPFNFAKKKSGFLGDSFWNFMMWLTILKVNKFQIAPCSNRKLFVVVLESNLAHSPPKKSSLLHQKAKKNIYLLRPTYNHQLTQLRVSLDPLYINWLTCRTWKWWVVAMKPCQSTTKPRNKTSKS